MAGAGESEGGVLGGRDVSTVVCGLVRRLSGEVTLASFVSRAELVVGLDVDADADSGAKSVWSMPVDDDWLFRLVDELLALFLPLKTSLNLPAGDLDRLESMLAGGCNPVLVAESCRMGSLGMSEETDTE